MPFNRDYASDALGFGKLAVEGSAVAVLMTQGRKQYQNHGDDVDGVYLPHFVRTKTVVVTVPSFEPCDMDHGLFNDAGIAEHIVLEHRLAERGQKQSDQRPAQV